MEILYRGAESIIYILNKKILVKERLKKNYRIKDIDDNLRKFRNRKEAKLLTESRKCGVPTPQIFEIDEKNFKIFMEFIDGKRIKEFLNECKESELKEICKKIGENIGRLHSNDIIHGDLTTSNMILKDDKVYFIDFGLGEFSSRFEDKAVDLRLLYDSLKSTHFNILNLAWSSIIEGYREEYKNADKVLIKIKEIEKRARYMER